MTEPHRQRSVAHASRCLAFVSILDNGRLNARQGRSLCSGLPVLRLGVLTPAANNKITHCAFDKRVKPGSAREQS